MQRRAVTLDTMQIRDLVVQCIIGTRPEERLAKQAVVINVTLECDLRPAGQSDKLDDTVNYSAICKQLITMAEQSSFQLIERLAQEVARVCLEDPQVSAVAVTVDKPHALTNARSAAVSIHRKRQA